MKNLPWKLTKYNSIICGWIARRPFKVTPPHLVIEVFNLGDNVVCQLVVGQEGLVCCLTWYERSFHLIPITLGHGLELLLSYLAAATHRLFTHFTWSVPEVDIGYCFGSVVGWHVRGCVEEWKNSHIWKMEKQNTIYKWVVYYQ